MSVEQVWEQFDAGLRGFISRRVADPEVAEDILQDVYLKIHARIDTVKSEESLRAWVYQVARNATLDYYRGLRPATDLPEVPYSPDDPIDEQAAQDLAQGVQAVLDRLPEEQREALLLTEYHGLTQVELASRLGISVSGAKSRVQRARARMKSMLLACCHFELDRAGRIVDWYPRREACCASADHASTQTHVLDNKEGEQ